jgi:hypothetical protein
MGRVADAMAGAVERVKRRIEIRDPAFAPTVIRVVDGETEGLAGPAGASLESVDGRQVGVIVVAAEELVTDSIDVVSMLAHELTHVLRYGGPGSNGAPLWIEEGIARWVEFEDEAPLHELLLAYSIHGRGVAAATVAELLGDEDALGNANMVTQDVVGAVFFHQVERRFGRATVAAIARGLLACPDWKGVFRDCTGNEVTELLSQAREDYIEWATREFATRKVIEHGSRVAESGGHSEAVAMLEEWARQNPTSSLLPWAERTRWRTLLASGAPEQALVVIHRFRKHWPRHCLATDSFVDELEALVKLKRRQDARELGTVLLRDYLWLRSQGTSRQRVRDLLQQHVD